LFYSFFFCVFSVLKATENVNIVREFKIVLMYFSEAFLKGAYFDGESLEGDYKTDVAKCLVEAIRTLETDHPEMPELGHLIKFRNQLATGIPIAVDIENPSTFERDANEIQNNFITALMENDGLIMPIGWKGHALAFVIKKGQVDGTFDLAFVNTGEGIKNHYHSKDPNGIYPLLSKIWVEFSGVPDELLFGAKAWFFQGLIAFKTDLLVDKLKKTFNYSKSLLTEYFYGTFLANFNQYLVQANNERLVPMQRIGSCTLSRY
jgi:hypothetical protein